MLSLMKNYELLDYYKDLRSVTRQLTILDQLIKVQLPNLSAHFVSLRISRENGLISLIIEKNWG